MKANPEGFNQYKNNPGGGGDNKNSAAGRALKGGDIDFAELARQFYGTGADGKLATLAINDGGADKKKGGKKAPDPAKEAEKAAKAEEKARKEAEKAAKQAKIDADNQARRDAVMSGQIPLALVPKYLGLGHFSKDEKLEIMQAVGIDPLSGNLRIPADKPTSTRAPATPRSQMADWTGQRAKAEAAAAEKKAAAEAKKKPATTSVAKTALARWAVVKGAHRAK